MIRTRMKFEGGNALATALRALPQKVRGPVMLEALKAAAEPMRRRASQLAPHEPGGIDLRDSITITVVRGAGAGQVRGFGTTLEDAQPTVAVGPSREAYWGFFQEFGTVHHSAQPFMRPAFDSEAHKALAEIGRAMWTALAGRGISRSGSTSSALQGEV